MATGINLVEVWNYLHKVLWNWAGILLAIDAGVALVERYLGGWVEEKYHRKLRVPPAMWLGFAVIVFVIAQAVAYHDLQGDMSQQVDDNKKQGQTVATVTQERDDLKKRPESCPQPRASVKRTALPSLDIRCQVLANCPPEELS